jgi:hypothetical protein
MIRRPSTSATRESRRPSVRRPGAFGIDLVLLAIILLLLPQTLELGAGARRFPLIMLAVMALLVLLDAAMEAFPAVRRRMGFLEADFVEVASLDVPELQVQPDDLPAESARTFRVLTVWQALAWLTALGAGMSYFGYVVTTPVFLGLFFLWARVPLRVAIGITLVMTCLNYFVFYDFLGLR